MGYYPQESLENTINTWQPLGPLLKVKLLVGYMLVTYKIPLYVPQIVGIYGCPYFLTRFVVDPGCIPTPKEWADTTCRCRGTLNDTVCGFCSVFAAGKGT